MKLNKKGITLIALVITIIVLIILSGVSISMIVGEDGIITQARKSSEETAHGNVSEGITKEYIGWLYEEPEGNFKIYLQSEGIVDNSGIVDIEKLLNIKQSFGNGSEKEDVYILEKQEDKYFLRYYYTNGTSRDILEIESSGEIIDWEGILANAKTPHPDQSETNKTIGIGTDGELVNMDLWNYELLEDGTYDLLGYIGNYSDECVPSYKGTIVEGKIQGKVPQYIKEEGKAFEKVTSMTASFGSLGIETAPEIPSTVTSMKETFLHCRELVESPEIPSGVTNIRRIFMECYKLTKGPEIPLGVTTMQGAFRACEELVESPEIPSSVEDMSYAFFECQSLIEGPEIPLSVKNMRSAFYNCYDLIKGSDIPSSVTNMDYAFYGCHKLTGDLIINANPTSYDFCFLSASTANTANLVLKGSSTMLNALKNTGSSNSHIVVGN